MGFLMTELVVESVLRDGFKRLKDSIDTSNDIVAQIFSPLKEAHLSEYYERDIPEIKRILLNEDIPISQGYSLDSMAKRFISINLLNSSESENLAYFSDHQGTEEEAITPSVIVTTFTADSYDSATGVVVMNTADPDLSNVRIGQNLVDGAGNSFSIIGGITNLSGDKRVSIATDQTVTLSGCSIQSNVAVRVYPVNSVKEQESLLITVAAEKDQTLMAKYLFTLVKYLLLSNKDLMLARGLAISTYSGSDFKRLEYLPENMFARFLTISVRDICNSWREDEATVVGAIDPGLNVLRDQFERDDEDSLTIGTVES